MVSLHPWPVGADAEEGVVVPLRRLEAEEGAERPEEPAVASFLTLDELLEDDAW